MSDNAIRFHELLEARLKTALAGFLQKELTPTTLREIRNKMYDTIASVFMNGSPNVKLTIPAMTWLTNRYFQTTKLNEDMVNELVIVNDWKLSDLSDHDIAVLYNVFGTAFFGDDIEKETYRRGKA